MPPPAVLASRRVTCPAWALPKSTRTSARSPGASVMVLRASGAASMPASLAICSIGAASLSRSTRMRALQPFSSRKTNPLPRCAPRRAEHAVDQQPIACVPHQLIDGRERVVDPAVGREALVLQHQRQIVDAPGIGQRRRRDGAVVDDQQAGQAGHHLPSGAPVGMRMEPAGGRRVRHRETRLPGGAWGDGLVRTAVDFCGTTRPCQCAVVISSRSLRTRIVVRSPVRNRSAGPSSAPL